MLPDVRHGFGGLSLNSPHGYPRCARSLQSAPSQSPRLQICLVSSSAAFTHTADTTPNHRSCLPAVQPWERRPLAGCRQRVLFSFLHIIPEFVPDLQIREMPLELSAYWCHCGPLISTGMTVLGRVLHSITGIRILPSYAFQEQVEYRLRRRTDHS